MEGQRLQVGLVIVAVIALMSGGYGVAAEAAGGDVTGRALLHASEEELFGRYCDEDSAAGICGHVLVCDLGRLKCGYCHTSEECAETHGDGTVCTTEMGDGAVGVCSHKPLFPLSVRDVLGSVCACVGAMFAAAGGLGGGGLFVPLFVLVMGFPAQSAIPLSKAMICGAAVVSYAINRHRRHPYADRPAIDYTAALMLEPMTLGGSIVGVFLNVIFPGWLVLVLLVLLMGATTYRTTLKGLQALGWVAGGEKPVEKSVKAGDREEEAGITSGVASGVMSGAVARMGGVDGGSRSGGGEPDRPSQRLEAILEAERWVPRDKVAVIAVVWVMVLALSMAKGGHGAPSVIGVETCTFAWWCIVLLAFPFVMGTTMFIGKRLRLEHAEKVELGYPFVHGDIRWNQRNTTVIPWMSFGAGVAAGLMGIGGGMIKGPLMLELGMDAKTSKNTSSFMILFTSSATTLQFLILGMLPLDYALWFALIGGASAYLGRAMLDVLSKRFNVNAFIILVIAGVIALSTVLLAYSGTLNVLDDLRSGAYMGLSTPC